MKPTLSECIALLESIEDGDMCVENIQEGDIAILLYYLRKLDEIDTLVREKYFSMTRLVIMAEMELII